MREERAAEKQMNSPVKLLYRKGDLTSMKVLKRGDESPVKKSSFAGALGVGALQKICRPDRRHQY